MTWHVILQKYWEGRRIPEGVTINPLTVEYEITHIVNWWFDASFPVHLDIKSHMGATMFLGKVSLYYISVRQSLKNSSSTESELLGVEDAMPMVLCRNYYFESQGYSVDTENTITDIVPCS